MSGCLTGCLVQKHGDLIKIKAYLRSHFLEDWPWWIRYPEEQQYKMLISLSLKNRKGHKVFLHMLSGRTAFHFNYGMIEIMISRLMKNKVWIWTSTEVG